MSYFDRLMRLLVRAQQRSATVWQAYAEDQTIDAATASSVLATQILQTNSVASNLASLSFAARQTVALQRYTPIPPIVRPDDSERLHKAATTVLQTAGASEVPRDIVARLVRSEALQSAADAFSAEMGTSLYAKGYTRQLNGDTCKRCTEWADSGRIFKPGTRFPMHPGCDCTPDPVFSTRDPKLPSYTLTRRD